VATYREFFRDQQNSFEHASVNSLASSQLMNRESVRGVFYKLRGRTSGRAGGRVVFLVQLPMVVSVAVAISVVSVMFGWPSDIFAEVLERRRRRLLISIMQRNRPRWL
jgi:hypothetical protein